MGRIHSLLWPCRAGHEAASLLRRFLFVWTQDPNSNRIAQWLEVAPQQGIAELSFQLAPEATLGTYTVAVAEGKTFGTFSVEEYGRSGNTRGQALGKAGSKPAKVMSRGRDCSFMVLISTESNFRNFLFLNSTPLIN